MKIKTVSVLGANGTMGRNVAAIFASFGNAKVYMVCRNKDDAIDAKGLASKSVKAEVIDKNLIAKTYDDIEECISNSDFIFESVSENFELKVKIYHDILQYIKPHTIIATGSSGLSIDELSDCFSDELKKNFMGVHFYNPPYNMTLCEVIPSRFTSPEVKKEVKEYLRKTLFRTVVEVKNEAAFMGNRIGFQFINEALRYAEIHKESGGIDYIDAILGGFSGRNMPPLVTSDFVGLDVHKAIVDNIYYNTNDYAHETFVFPEFAEELVSQNRLGRKTKGGLYKSRRDEAGNRVIEVYDIITHNYREANKYHFEFAETMKRHFRNGKYYEAFESLVNEKSVEAGICLQFILQYVIYSLFITKSIGENIFSADHVLATGYNWAPPLSIIDAFGGISRFRKLVFMKLSEKYILTADVDNILSGVTKSVYDYRPFFKAK